MGDAILGLVGARYRDLEPLVVAFLPILFFVSPVIYSAKQLGDLQPFLLFNPLAYWVGMIRDPIMGDDAERERYIYALVITVVGWAADAMDDLAKAPPASLLDLTGG